jgi:hypothetical protein
VVVVVVVLLNHGACCYTGCRELVLLLSGWLVRPANDRGDRPYNLACTRHEFIIQQVMRHAWH